MCLTARNTEIKSEKEIKGQQNNLACLLLTVHFHFCFVLSVHFCLKSTFILFFSYTTLILLNE